MIKWRFQVGCLDDTKNTRIDRVRVLKSGGGRLEIKKSRIGNAVKFKTRKLGISAMKNRPIT